MTRQAPLNEIFDAITNGTAVPYLGPGVLQGCTSIEDGKPMPITSDDLIIAMNQGRPMAPKLMYEFPRAAMNLELKKGRGFVTRFFNDLYTKTEWSRAPLHDQLATLMPGYVIDINRDTQLQESYADTPHTLVRGIARIGGTDYRFQIHHYDGQAYKEIDQSDVDTTLPVLFKPMGSPLPDPTFIASDADYVDYITELMGGFAIPDFLKNKRKGLKYVLLGLRLTRDTERMVLSDIVYDAAEPKGWALIPEATAKERRFCAKLGFEVVDADVDALFGAANALEAAS